MLPFVLLTLKEYFLVFVPKQPNFKTKVAKTDRYKRIAENLKNPLIAAYIGFIAFASNDFEDFLLPFQSSEPKIHLLYSAMCNLVSVLMRKFIKTKNAIK